MRNFIIGVVAAVAGYFLFTHQDWWIGYIPFFHKSEPTKYTEQKETYAWKMFLRKGDDPYTVRVLLIDGNRWRVESRKVGSSKTQVAVSDGTHTVASPPMGSTVTLDPRPQVNQFLAGAIGEADEAVQNQSQETEERDGHTCWKTSVKLQGMDMEMWADSTSSLPVCVETTLLGLRLEIHIEPMEVDFEKDGAKYFDTANTTSAFEDELADDVNKERIAHFTRDKSAAVAASGKGAPVPTSATGGQQQPANAGTPPPQAAGQPLRYFLKEAVSLNNFYGTMTIPANTEVRILRQTAGGYRVAAGGQEFDVQAGQLSNSPE